MQRPDTTNHFSQFPLSSTLPLFTVFSFLFCTIFSGFVFAVLRALFVFYAHVIYSQFHVTIYHSVTGLGDQVNVSVIIMNMISSMLCMNRAYYHSS